MSKDKRAVAPCPFCGAAHGKPVLKTRQCTGALGEDDTYSTVQCEKCLAEGPRVYRYQLNNRLRRKERHYLALTLWNNRTPSEELTNE